MLVVVSVSSQNQLVQVRRINFSNYFATVRTQWMAILKLSGLIISEKNYLK